MRILPAAPVLCMILGCTPAAADTPAPGIAGARSATRPATQPAKLYGSIDAVPKVIPAGVLPSKPDQWTVVKIDASNAFLEENVQGRRLRLRLHVRDFLREGTQGYAMTAVPQDLPLFTLNAHVLFSPQQLADAARLNPGDDVVIEGEVTSMAFLENANPVPLEIHIAHPVIVK